MAQLENNREHLYRGQTTDGRWVFGFLVESTKTWQGGHPHKSWILGSPHTNGGWFCLTCKYPVKDKTVGEFSGVKDKNGLRIFEDDIVAAVEKDGTRLRLGRIIFKEGCFLFTYGKIEVPLRCLYNDQLEVVGNMYDTPELLANTSN